MKRLVISIILLATISACGGQQKISDNFATVIRVVDGDTVVLSVNGSVETVRLIGVNTPETVHPTKPIECFGPQASAFMHSVLKPKTKVQLRRDVEARDRYQRLLVYLYLTDGTFINQELVRLGFARTMSIQPNTAFASKFAAVQTEASKNRIGLWFNC